MLLFRVLTLTVLGSEKGARIAYPVPQLFKENSRRRMPIKFLQCWINALTSLLPMFAHPWGGPSSNKPGVFHSHTLLCW
eukprot:3065262-Amphidinium_carterae.1